MGNTGYGLARMAQGLSQGMVQGNLQAMMMQDKKDERAQNQNNQDRTFNQAQSNADRQFTETKRLNDISAYNKGLSLAVQQKTPKAAAELFNLVYTGDQKLTAGSFQFLGPDAKAVTITLPGNGPTFTGDQAAVSGLLQQIAANPTMLTTPELRNRVIADAARMGVSIVYPPAQKAITVSPGSAVIDAKTHKEVYKNPKTETPDKLTKNEMLSQTRAFYAFKTKALLDPETGAPRPGQEANYNKVIAEYQTDVHRIGRGEAPFCLLEQNSAKKTVVLIGEWNGRPVAQYSDGSIAYAD
jgi:hypothetical protein